MQMNASSYCRRGGRLLTKAYLEAVRTVTDDIERTQFSVILRIADRIASSIEQGGVLHLFGSGHSHMVAEDTFHRAGGLACVNAML